MEENRKLFKSLFEMLELDYKVPGQTIGTSVKSIFESVLKKYFKIKTDDELRSHVINASHEEMILNLGST